MSGRLFTFTWVSILVLVDVPLEDPPREVSTSMELQVSILVLVDVPLEVFAKNLYQ